MTRIEPAGQPRSGKLPITLDRAHIDALDFCDHLAREIPEEAVAPDPSRPRRDLGKPVERGIHPRGRFRHVRLGRGGALPVVNPIEVDPGRWAAFAAPGHIDQDLARGTRRGTKEVGPVIPVRRPLQLEPALMDHHGQVLPRVRPGAAAALTSQDARNAVAELVIDL